MILGPKVIRSKPNMVLLLSIVQVFLAIAGHDLVSECLRVP